MARYSDAIRWIIYEDDTCWLDDEENIIPSVSTHMVADLFNKDIEVVIRDLKHEKEKSQRSRVPSRTDQ